VAESPHDLLGSYLKKARLAARMSQAGLARMAKLPRLRLVRAEAGAYALNLDEVVRVATVLKVPLQRLTNGRARPGNDLQWLAIELYQLGIRDLEIAGARLPGALRVAEQVVTAALGGAQPEPRVVEAMPSILARRKLNVPLTLAFADQLDPRVRTRLAWLSDITLILSQLSTFPAEVRSPAQLRALVSAGGRPAAPDSLGHPGEGKPPRLWTKWKITYAGTLATFTRRTQEVEAAFERSAMASEPEE
jgi:transcriptional regulator with XRE-family HTH domain